MLIPAYRILLVMLLLSLALVGCSSGDDNAAEVEALREQVADLQAQLDAATSNTIAISPPSTTTAGLATTTTITTTSSAPRTTAAPIETVDGFMAEYVAALRAGDSVYLTQRLHPQLVEAYGEDQCRDFVASFGADPSYVIDVQGVSGPEEWAIRIDGIDFVFGDTYTLRTETTTSAGTTSPDLHLGLVDNRLHWFTDCGDPRSIEVVPPEEALASISGDTTSSPFEAPSSWRIEVTTSGFCGVSVMRDGDGSLAEVKSGESDFVIQVRESGSFYIETSGCTAAVALEN